LDLERFASAFGDERRDGMDAIRFNEYGLGRLIDSQIELCELFEGARAPGRREAPVLISLSSGKAPAECLADLVDQALAVYEGSGFAQDPRIFALKFALTESIVEMSCALPSDIDPSPPCVLQSYPLRK
jgi:hypothetical protein